MKVIPQTGRNFGDGKELIINIFTWLFSHNHGYKTRTRPTGLTDEPVNQTGNRSELYNGSDLQMNRCELG